MAKSGKRRSVRVIVLTEVDRTFLYLSAEGKGNAALCAQMGVGESRVKAIRARLKDKLGLPSGSNVEDMLSAARKQGLIP